jgi:crossover junction endodeoxyribonuclease RusA|tara:strand:- start:68 stop:448 length:381 start_codon:yes stop_codon:yes gene_type:complete
MSGATVDIKLPWGTSANVAYIRTMRGIALSKTGRLFREHVVTQVEEDGQDLGLEGKLSVSIELFEPNKRRRDIDNLIKPLLDALEAANVFVNDFQINSLSICRAGYKSGGLMKVKIIEDIETGEET